MITKIKYSKLVCFVEDVPCPLTNPWLDTTLVVFKDSTYGTLVFPKTLNSHDRQRAHTFAQRHNLYSKSVGARNEDRHLHVFKSQKEKGWGSITLGITPVFETFGLQLFLGSGRDARHKNSLEDFGITTVINCAEEWEEDQAVLSTASWMDFSISSRIPMEDATEIKLVLHSASQYLNSTNGNVLIHCVDGNSRAPAFVIGVVGPNALPNQSAYLLLINNLPLSESFQKVKDKRPHANIPSRMLAQLEQEKYGYNTMTPEDWKHMAEGDRAIPTTPQARALSSAEIEDICLCIADLELLLDSVEQACHGKYSKKYIDSFTTHCSASISNTWRRKLTFDATQVEWNAIHHHVEKYIKGWYEDRIATEEDLAIFFS